MKDSPTLPNQQMDICTCMHDRDVRCLATSTTFVHVQMTSYSAWRPSDVPNPLLQVTVLLKEIVRDETKALAGTQHVLAQACQELW